MRRRKLHPVIARSKATKQSISRRRGSVLWIASRSLSSGAHSRDPLARNDGWEIVKFQRKKPAVICDGRPVSACSKFCGRYATQRLLDLTYQKAFRSPKRSQDLGDDAADAGAGDSNGARRSGRQIENPAADERSPVIDGDDHA